MLNIIAKEVLTVFAMGLAGCFVVSAVCEYRLKRMDALLNEVAPADEQEAQCLPCQSIFDVVVPPGGFDDDAELSCPKCGEKTLELIP